MRLFLLRRVRFRLVEPFPFECASGVPEATSELVLVSVRELLSCYCLLTVPPIPAHLLKFCWPAVADPEPLATVRIGVPPSVDWALRVRSVVVIEAELNLS